MKYDRQPSAPSMIQKIKALQVKLNATKDRREQRALEDDVTGKILWLFWCGICAEVDELLPKVVDYIRREGNKMGLRSMYDIVRSTERRDPGHDQVYFQRVMFDAETGTSKHHLWLAAHTAKQAKPSDTASHTSAIDTSRVPLGYTSNIAESMLFVQINSTQG
ncbi:hypothetical protein EV401DRAFT_458466 [Pisolithus croceorrhizus]|nr:hypothetical protein EV401DRAFT_458466 [Pisolithus croceorrhizus]